MLHQRGSRQETELQTSVDVSVVVPTYCEVENVPLIVARVAAALATYRHEIIIVDDNSPDGTAKAGLTLQNDFPQLRVIERRAERGLAASMLDGFRAASGRFLAVIDADLQHDETRLPVMAMALEAHSIAIGSRYGLDDAGTKGWSYFRLAGSRMAAKLSASLLGLKVGDPLSGFFMLRRATFERADPKLQAKGFKLLIDILVHSQPRSIVEIPFVFRDRRHGESKLNGKVVTDWLRQLFALRRAKAQLKPRESIAPTPRLEPQKS